MYLKTIIKMGSKDPLVAVAVLVVVVGVLVSSCHGWSCNTTLQDLYPGWDASPYSCEGRCGETYRAGACACDWHCGLYRDCCEDMAETCPHDDFNNSAADALSGSLTSSPDHHLHQNSSLLPQMTPGSLPDSLPKAVPNSLRKSLSLPPSPRGGSPMTVSRSLPSMARCAGNARLISVCPTPVSMLRLSVLYGGRRIEAREVLHKCQTPWEEMSPPDFLQLLPVSDRLSRHHFLNIYCFLCHGGHVSQAVPWTLSFVFSLAAVESSMADSPQSVLEVMDMARDSKAPVVVFPPSNLTARRCGLRYKLVFKCPCPDLKDTCTGEVEAYIEANYQLYPHPSCMRCAFIWTGMRPLMMQVPDLEQWLWRVSNVLFLVNVAWRSENTANTTNVTVTLSYDPKPGRSLFTWERMECQVSMDVSGKDQTTDLGGLENQNTIGNDTTQESDVHQESNDTDGGEEEKKRNPIANSQLQCEQTACASGFQRTAGVCRSYPHKLYLNVKMSCVDPVETNPLPSLSLLLGPKSKLVTGGQNTRERLAKDLQRRLDDMVVVVSNPSVCWDEDRCYWAVSVEAAFLTGPDRTGVDRERLASTMYFATTTTLSRQLTAVKYRLMVCVRVRSLDRRMDNGGPCAYSTILWPEGVGGDATGNGFNWGTLMCALLLVRWAF